MDNENEKGVSHWQDLLMKALIHEWFITYDAEDQPFVDGYGDTFPTDDEQQDILSLLASTPQQDSP